jgi:hypothetical protein
MDAKMQSTFLRTYRNDGLILQAKRHTK